MANKFDMGKVGKAVKTQLEASLTLIGAEAKNHFVRSFRDGGFTDKSLQRWKPRKKETKKTIGRGVLIGPAADLRKSIVRKGINKSNLSVVIATDKKYAAVHNLGLKAGRGNGFIMPKRQFIGDSYQLNNKVKAIIISRTNKAFK